MSKFKNDPRVIIVPDKPLSEVKEKPVPTGYNLWAMAAVPPTWKDPNPRGPDDWGKADDGPGTDNLDYELLQLVTRILFNQRPYGKIPAIKAAREFKGWGLLEAKNYVEKVSADMEKGGEL